MGKNEINLADNLINIINTARENALKKVNEELINMYWQVGEYLHKESQKSMFGDSYIDSIAKEIQEEFPGIKGFNRRGLYRMKQFYETYAENDVVTPLVTQFERWNICMGNDLMSAAGLIHIIEESRQNALKKVNEELIKMYWKVGEFLSKETEHASYGDAYIDEISREIQETFPGIKGFNRRGLYRMKKFYETYKDNEIVTPLVTQISWTNHLLIMSGCKTDEEREFYIRLCIKENYSKRQLERQLDSGYYERYMLSKETLLPESVKKLGENPFLDSYVMEFLDLPNEFHENDLRKALIRNMKDFILELGKDFTFIDEEYKVQVGGDDFRIDLLFYHRGLQCLVAIELKIGKFKPEYISKLDFYLEALDRQVKKENENPSVGLLLCAAKNDEVVEYAMSRTMSPMLVSQYQLQLPDKAVLEKKLQQLVNLPQIED